MHAPSSVVRRFEASGLKAAFVGRRPVRPAPTLARRANLFGKAIFDVVFSALALLALSPLLLLVAAAVKFTSPGPVLFKQQRHGKDGKPFGIYKFRTMYEHLGDPTGVAHTTVDDERITPVGRFIRRNNLDELPQLINVLRREMSLVGPRPHAIGMQAAGVAYEELVDFYFARLQMLPGVTGWAQANGLRGPATDPDLARARIEHDIAYIQNFSLALDLKAILLTLRNEIRGGTGQ